MNIPAELLYSKEDEWIKVEGDTATIGISDYAQDQLSDIVYLELNLIVGVKGELGEMFGAVESVKAAFDIYAQASDLVASGDFNIYDYSNIRFRFRLTVATAGRHGASAQNPSNGGGGIVNGINRLSLMTAAPTKIFDGGRRTAASRGSLLDHAVSFRTRYNLRGANAATNNYDLSMGAGALGATVTYTVYTP